MPKSASVDIAALLNAHTRRRRGGKCTIGLILATLDPDVRAKIEAAFLDETRYSAPGLAEALTKLTGEKVSGTTTQRHRRRECLCP